MIANVVATRQHVALQTLSRPMSGRNAVISRPRLSAVCVRAQLPEDDKSADLPSTSELSPEASPVAETSTSFSRDADATAVTANMSDFKFFGQTQEAINGRASMLGFVAAVLAERATHQSVWSQIAGKRNMDGDLLQSPIGGASVGFAAVVVLLSLASAFPRLIDGETPSSRSFGPFTPFLEANLGRLAMLGFSGLILVELGRGNNPLF